VLLRALDTAVQQKEVVEAALVAHDLEMLAFRAARAGHERISHDAECAAMHLRDSLNRGNWFRASLVQDELERLAEMARTAADGSMQGSV
jgi:hypothetical protein